MYEAKMVPGTAVQFSTRGRCGARRALVEEAAVSKEQRGVCDTGRVRKLAQHIDKRTSVELPMNVIRVDGEDTDARLTNLSHPHFSTAVHCVSFVPMD